MKLQYTYETNYGVNKACKLLLRFYLVIFSFFLILSLIGVTNFDFFSNLKFLLISCFVMVLIYFPFFMIAYFNNKRKRNKNKYLFENGRRIQGYIVDVVKETIRYRYSTSYIYKLKVMVENEVCLISDIENNEAYQILESKLSKSYSSNGEVKFNPILIDIYEKDNRIYADLNSVKLS